MKNEFKDVKLIRKGYQINLDKVEDGFLYSGVVCNAESITQAKKILFEKIKYDDMRVLNRYLEPVEVSYLNIPVIRCIPEDVYEFEGAEKPHWKIEMELNRRERFAKLDAIIADENVSHCYIMKRGVYYAPNSNGYTERRTMAGVYEKSEAVSHAKGCDELTIVPIVIEEHNAIIEKAIELLKANIISTQPQ